MEQRIVDYITDRIWRGNTQAFVILTNIAVDMLRDGHTEESIKIQIDRLLTERKEV